MILQPEGRYLAEVNIGRLHAPPDDPRVAEFVAALDQVNALAERMPGFVWRYQDASGAAIDTPWSEDAREIANLSVWTDIESLERFVWGTVHRVFYARRAEWFETLSGASMAMWWVAPDHRPDFAEARHRLAHLAANGPSDYAFDWASAREATRWRTARCA